MTVGALEEEVSRCFSKGKFKAVISLLGSSPIDPLDPLFEFKTSFQLAAFVFLGHFREALVLFQRALNFSQPSSLFLCRCRFFLGIGSVRQSDYSRAVEYFSENLISLRRMKLNSVEPLSEEIFYSYQGSAFYRFFRGQFQKSNELTKKSYAIAYESEFDFGQVLSLDLMGHSLCQIGSVNRGILELENALFLAQKIGNGGLATAIIISLVKYRAQFGHDLHKTLSNLKKAIESLQPEDTYSKAELYLELIRQLILRGRGLEAKNILEAAGQLIYQHQNRRQYAVFNLRCAYLQYLYGERQAALALAVSLKSNLDPRVDFWIFQQTNGLIEKMSVIPTENRNSSSLAIATSTNAVDMRIRCRSQSKKLIPVNLGEDHIGDLLDMISNGDKNALDQIKRLGLWGLLPKVLKLPIGARGFYLGPSRSEMIVFSGADFGWIDGGLTSPMKKLISKLKGTKFKSKEFLIHQIWGYTYDPSRHDRLLHATIGKLRNLLGKYGAWIEWSSEGYRLADFVLILSDSAIEKGIENGPRKNHRPPNDFQSHSILRETELNRRQFKLLNSMDSGESVSVREYSKLFKICTMTACRDLTSLHLAGHMIRKGRGRATVYELP